MPNFDEVIKFLSRPVVSANYSRRRVQVDVLQVYRELENAPDLSLRLAISTRSFTCPDSTK